MNQSAIIDALGPLGVKYIPFLFALCFHEFAHGYIAKKKGDNTAELMGRLTLSPFAHADIMGTFILPIFGILSGWGFIFGWAKPVPVNSRNLKHPKNDMFWIALAGPMSNILLAVVSLILLQISAVTLGAPSETTMMFFNSFFYVNILLAVFNMIPIHPLDGGKVVERFLPYEANRFLEENQMTLQIILFGFFLTFGGGLLAGVVHAVADVIKLFILWV